MSEAVLVRRSDDLRAIRDLRARHVFAFVDGRTSLYDVLMSSGLPLEEAIAGLAALFDAKAVDLEAAEISESA